MIIFLFGVKEAMRLGCLTVRRFRSESICTALHCVALICVALRCITCSDRPAFSPAAQAEPSQAILSWRGRQDKLDSWDSAYPLPR